MLILSPFKYPAVLAWPEDSQHIKNLEAEIVKQSRTGGEVKLHGEVYADLVLALAEFQEGGKSLLYVLCPNSKKIATWQRVTNIPKPTNKETDGKGSR